MEWLEDFALKRKAQRTNCFIFETFDMKRLDGFKVMAKNGKIKQLLETETDYQWYEYNLQKDELLRRTQDKWETMTGDPMQQGSVLSRLDDLLTNQSCIAIIQYVFESRHAQMLSDYLAHWSRNADLYEQHSTVIVFVSDAGLFNETLRRLCYTVSINPSSADERRELLHVLANKLRDIYSKKYETQLKVKVTEDQVQASSGLDLHSTETAAFEGFFINPKRQFDVSKFTEYKIQILKTYGLEYSQPSIGYDRVGDYVSLKAYMQNNVIMPLRNPEIAAKYGVGLPKGVILIGYHGTGKTLFAEATSKELGLPMIKLSPADLFRGIVGESESRVKQITTIIESLAPAVVMIDEIDQIAIPREQMISTDSGVSRRIINMLLEWLGQRNRRTFLIGCTNFATLDSAFIRAGRIDEICIVLPPNRIARKEILEIHMDKARKVPVEPKEKEAILVKMAEETFGWTGAELEKLVLTAARLGMTERSETITLEHFLSAKQCFDVDQEQRRKHIDQLVNQVKQIEFLNKNFLKEALAEFQKGEGKEDARLKALIESI